MLTRLRTVAIAQETAWIGFFGVIIAAWAGLFALAQGQTHGAVDGVAVAGLPLGGFPTLLAMWLVMSAAMMLPTLIPSLAVLARLPARVGAGRTGWWGVIGGYATVWAAVSAGLAAFQVAVVGRLAGPLSAPALSAGLLAVAGLWQFTRGKELCQTACLSPMAYFAGRFRPGALGGTVMGAEIGLTCVGCCWAIMALALVGGMNSLWFMGLATVFMVAEKLPQVGLRVRRPAGAALLGAAALVWLTGAGA